MWGVGVWVWWWVWRWVWLTFEDFGCLDNLAHTYGHLLGEGGQLLLLVEAGLEHNLVDQLQQRLEGYGTLTPRNKCPEGVRDEGVRG